MKPLLLSLLLINMVPLAAAAPPRPNLPFVGTRYWGGSSIHDTQRGSPESITIYPNGDTVMSLLSAGDGRVVVTYRGRFRNVIRTDEGDYVKFTSDAIILTDKYGRPQHWCAPCREPLRRTR